MEDSVLQFYEQLASNYHLIFADWKRAVLQQGVVLDTLIRPYLGAPPLSVLDCSCGIGTQAIGLAVRGYRVHATDLSPTAVERAEREAGSFGVAPTFGVADLRALETQVEGAFDVVLSCDNSVPHLLSEEELLLTARNMWSKVRANGLLLVSIRDYDQLVREKPRAEKPRIFDSPEGRRIVFQVWDWLPGGRTYTVHLFIVSETPGDWKTAHYATEYRALLRDEFSKILRDAGFAEICWHMPEDSGYYQPIVTARKR
ncbi:MAG: methyltransferase domain-containing protein [Deltaproteobacteria bacterium]|nr:methyltransferase domain-containing protein [Deltaproteobacteria bacterium]